MAHGLFENRATEFEGVLSTYKGQRSLFRDGPFYGQFRLSQHGRKPYAEDMIDAELEDLDPAYKIGGKVDHSRVPLDISYEVRKRIYDKEDRVAFLESMYYSDAFAITEAIQRTDKEASKSATAKPPLNRDNAVFAELGLAASRFLGYVNGRDATVPARAQTFEAFSEKKSLGAAEDTLWYRSRIGPVPLPTPQHYAEFYAELIAAIPAAKRTNEADFAAAFLKNNIIPDTLGWQTIFDDPAQKKTVARILGIDNPATIADMEDFYRAIIKGLNNDEQRTALIKFADSFASDEQQKILHEELNTIGNARRLYIYANLGYDYLQFGEDKLSGTDYGELKTSVTTLNPAFTASINETEQRIKNNQNFRISVGQNTYLVSLGKYIQDNSTALGITRSVVAGATDAEFATYAVNTLLNKISAEALSAGDLKFTTSFLSATRPPRWLNNLLTASDTIQGELRTALDISADIALKEELLLNKIWEKRTDTKAIEFFTKLSAGLEFDAVKKEFAKIQAIESAEIIKLRDYIKLGSCLHTEIPELSVIAGNIGSEDHKKKVKIIEDSLKQTNQANRITELLHLVDMLHTEYLKHWADPHNRPPGTTTADVDRSNQIIKQRLTQLATRREELLDLQQGKNLIRAGDVSFGTLLAGLFGPHAHTAAHKAKDGSIWGAAVARLEDGMLTYRTKIKLSDGTETTKLVDAYDPDFMLGSSLQTFLLNNDHVDHEAIYEATLKRHQYLTQNNGYITAYDETGAHPDELGRFTTSRSNYYLTMQDYNVVFNNKNWGRSLFLDIFITAYVGLPLLGITAAFLAVTYTLFLPSILFGGEKWGLPAVKFNPFSYLMKALWFTPHQKAEINLSRQVTDIFFEKMQADLFSDIYVLSPSSEKFLQQMNDTTNNTTAIASSKARERYHQVKNEFDKKVEEHLQQKHAGGANITDDDRTQARKTILMKELGMTEQQYTEMKRQCISKTNEQDADKNKTSDTPSGATIMLPS